MEKAKKNSIPFLLYDYVAVMVGARAIFPLPSIVVCIETPYFPKVRARVVYVQHKLFR
jgi:hypothetical protein